MARKLEWFPFFAAAFQTDEKVRLMDTHQVGCYTLWLCHQWINGSLPAEKSQALALLLSQALAGLQNQASDTAKHDLLDRAESVLVACFPVSPDDPTRRRNPKLEEIRAEQVATRERLSEAGKKGGRPKGGLSKPVKPGLSRDAKASLRIKRREEKSSKRVPESVPDGETGKPGAATWLTEFGKYWELYVGHPNYPRMGKVLAPLRRQHGHRQVLATWIGYLADDLGPEGKQFASLPRFAETYMALARKHAYEVETDGTHIPIPDEPEEVAA